MKTADLNASFIDRVLMQKGFNAYLAIIKKLTLKQCEHLLNLHIEMKKELLRLYDDDEDAEEMYDICICYDCIPAIESIIATKQRMELRKSLNKEKIKYNV